MTFLVPSITLIVLGRLVRKQPSLFNMEKFGSIKSDDETAIDYVYELDEQTFRRAI
jgi:hypothetical protein